MQAHGPTLPQHLTAVESELKPVKERATRPGFTFAVHPHLQTLEQAAVLAPVALLARHLAVLVPAAAIDALVADAALEEALAALAGNDAIVQARGPVPADEAGSLVSRIICSGRTTHTVTHTSGGGGL